MKKILIIGIKSFIAQNITNFLKDYFILSKVSYSQFNKISKKQLINFDYLINCSVSKKYVQNKYMTSNDLDLQIAKKISRLSIKMSYCSLL